MSISANSPVKLEEEEYDQDMEATVEAPQRSLTAEDRCDRCGAQAYLVVEIADLGELMFCAHHSQKHGPKLAEVGTVVLDDTAKLTEEKVDTVV